MMHLKLLHAILITVQLDATQSSLFINLQVHSTCFGCQPHPSSGVQCGQASLAALEGGRCTVPAAVVFFVQLPPSNVAKLVWPRWREVAAHYRRQ